MSTDGTSVFIADPGVEGGGVIFRMELGTNELEPMAGTEGLSPTALVVVGDDLFFTGVSDGPAVMRVSTEGGEAEVIISGAPLENPDGVAVAPNGDIYVADQGAGGDTGFLVRLTEFGTAEVVVDSILMGDPAGSGDYEGWGDRRRVIS